MPITPKNTNMLLERQGPSYGVPVPVVSGVPFDACRTIVCGTAGTATLTDSDGNVATDFPLQAGYNPIGGIVQIDLGTASDVWIIQ